MKFRIHFEIGEYQDYIDIEGETIEEIKEIAKSETDKRGLDEVKNNLWSEQLS
jgi:hypothetical protein